MPVNPYVIGQWVRGTKFYGRALQLEEILEGHRNWLWLLGTRRIGKTSLLKQLEFLASRGGESAYFPVFWDFQGADDPEELHRCFREAILDAADRLHDLGIGEEDVEGSDLFDSLGRLRRRLRSCDKRLLLLCDEVEELIKLHRKDSSVLRKLRRAMQSHEEIRSVLASTIRLWALAEQRGDTSPFLHGFAPPVYLRGLNDDEARALIRQENLSEARRPRIDEMTVEEIRSRCDNHPYLIQLVAKRYLEVRDLGEAIEQVAADQMVSYFFSVDFEMLSDAERDVIRIIAEASAASSDSILGKIAMEPGELSGFLLRLEHLGYIRRDAGGRFQLVNYFFRRWFQERPHSRLPMAERGSKPREGRPVADRPTQVDEVPQVVLEDRYTLLQELGRGAVGVVYKARDEVLGEMIAIKILKPEYCANTGVLDRFHREILLARDIGHPNILRVYHLGDHKGQKYLSMKLIEGKTLAGVIAGEKPLPLDRTVEIGWKLASALEAAHAQKVIHRDIKPQNILIDERGDPYLTDFGLARLLDVPGTTQAGVFLGTPQYASPEQARLHSTDERSDVYSLGLVLYEMATGRRPFLADSSEKILELHQSAPVPDPRECRPEIPAALAELINRCLEKEPARRPQSARTLRLALEELLDS